MKRAKILSALLALCLLLPSMTAYPTPATVDFSMTADVQTVKEGESIRFDVFIGTEMTVEGGVIRLTVPDDVFAEPVTEITLNLDEPAVFDSETPVASFEFTLADAVLEQDEDEKNFTVSIDGSTYITSEGSDFIPSENTSVEFTVLPATTEGEITLYAPLESTEGITASLQGGQEPIEAALRLDGSRLVFSVRRSALEQGVDYTLSVSGDGYTSAQTEFSADEEVTVSGLYPGDVNGDGEIDIYDFNLLCAFISYEQDDISADFDRNGTVDEEDIIILKNGYNAKKAGGSND